MRSKVAGTETLPFFSTCFRNSIKTYFFTTHFLINFFKSPPFWDYGIVWVLKNSQSLSKLFMSTKIEHFNEGF